MTDKIGMLKKLREETALSMSECKTALEEVGYNYDEAITFLRERGKNIASKKSGRATGQGMVAVKTSDSGVAVIELRCETDFVSAGDSFCELADQVAAVALENKAASAEDLLNAQGGKVKELITGGIATLGENIELKTALYKPVDSGVVYYVHNASQSHQNLGQIVSVVIYKSDNKEKVKDAMRSIAMHIAAATPSHVKIEDVPEEVISEEKRIYAEQAKSTGKPAGVIEKMIEGRIAKFFQENVLMEQAFVVDPDVKVSDVVAKAAKENGCQASIESFVLVKLAN